MTQYTHNPSSKYQAVVAALEDLLREEGHDAVTRAYATAVCDAVKDEFIEHEGVRTSTAVPNFHKIMRKSYRNCRVSMPNLDHRSIWVKDGKPEVLLSQPYWLDLKTLRYLVGLADDWGVNIDVNAQSWYFPGAALNVMIHPPKNPEAWPKDRWIVDPPWV